ncbi:uncharacterized protein LOC123317520 isoform X2 [Coccinella septempunctata]|uniref:uncharacterized protein LOC123317520 isoform X2 n=1 Tax=Coccinella septempunctata TaxID=41139 RepID=UPI001D0737AA|nr:uncharacterized protein LOC123317520 isoform X2 [Coccinella septempunctata]
MNSFWVVIRIPGFWMKILEAVSSLILSVHLAKNHVRYWIDREYHVFFISGSAGYLLISIVFIVSYIKDRPSVLLERSVLLVLGFINLSFGILACFMKHVEIQDGMSLMPLGIMMITCGIVSLSDWLVQRIMGGWDRYYFPRRMAHSSHTIF